MITNTDPSFRYAGYLPRLGSLVLDVVIFLMPIGALTVWGTSHSRLFGVYFIVPVTLSGLFYFVYLVRRFGGTPGKLIVGIRIRKLNGEPVGYREALFRYLPGAILGAWLSLSMVLSVVHMSDAEYSSFSLLDWDKRIDVIAPSWLQWLQGIWFWSELIVLTTNRKRRGFQDFIAGTVVIYASPASPEPTHASPVTSAPVD